MIVTGRIHSIRQHDHPGSPTWNKWKVAVQQGAVVEVGTTKHLYKDWVSEVFIRFCTAAKFGRLYGYPDYQYL